MARILVLLLICMSSVSGCGSTLTQSVRQLDESTLGLMAHDADYESGRCPDAYLGDQPGDVVRVTTSEMIGFPVCLADGTVMMWSTTKVDDKWIARAVFSKDNALTWSQPADLFEFPHRQNAKWSAGASLVDDESYLHLFGLEYYQFDFKDRSKAKSHLWHARSRDNGKTWDPV